LDVGARGDLGGARVGKTLGYRKRKKSKRERLETCAMGEETKGDSNSIGEIRWRGKRPGKERPKDEGVFCHHHSRALGGQGVTMRGPTWVFDGENW